MNLSEVPNQCEVGEHVFIISTGEDKKLQEISLSIFEGVESRKIREVPTESIDLTNKIEYSAVTDEVKEYKDKQSQSNLPINSDKTQCCKTTAMLSKTLAELGYERTNALKAFIEKSKVTTTF